MFESLSKLFGQPEKSASQPIEPKLAVAALLVHLASVDGASSPVEAKAISVALKDHYGLEDAEVKKLITEAQRRDRDAVDFYQFTSKLSQLDQPEKIDIIRMMWQVVFADGANHEMEDNMVWRVAELLGISNRERTILRKQARPDSTSADADAEQD